MPERRPRFARLLPPGPPALAEEIVESFGLPALDAGDAEGTRPRVLLNMVSSLDGRASLGGRSGAISAAADRALFHALRGAVDAVLVGAGTMRTERYGRIVPDAERRRWRTERSLAPEPLACVVSARLVFDPDIPLLCEPQARVVLLTSSAASLPDVPASVEYVRAREDGGSGALDLARALGELRARFGVRTLLCEGGPHLARQLFAAGLIDELHLSLAPLLLAGEPAAGEALRILAGAELEPAPTLALAGAHSSEDYLFLRYVAGSAAPERVSRETTSSSSLAR